MKTALAFLARRSVSGALMMSLAFAIGFMCMLGAAA